MTDALPPHPPPGRPASLARRVVPAVAVLGAAGGLLVLLDHPGDSEAATGPDGTADVGLATPSTSPAPTTTLPSDRGATSRPSTTTTVPGPPRCSGTTISGDSVSTRYGPVQVKVTIDGDGRVCAADATSYPSSDRRSQSINARAVPQLDQKAVAAGTASFNGVSGATITSNAYKRSLQSALDKA